VQPPTMIKSFSPTTIALGEPTLLFLEVSNPNPQETLTGGGTVRAGGRLCQRPASWERELYVQRQ
jgi:hypothetical protein